MNTAVMSRNDVGFAVIGGDYHPLGCLCAFPFFAPNLPERQREIRARMQVVAKQERQAYVNGLAANLMRNDRSWRAVLPILTSHMFRGDGRVWRHVNLEDGTIYFKRILRDHTFSSGEYRLLEIAASLFNDNHKLNLYEACSGLDYTRETLLLDAIATFMGVRR